MSTGSTSYTSCDRNAKRAFAKLEGTEQRLAAIRVVKTL
jgi:hypothetical protein